MKVLLVLLKGRQYTTDSPINLMKKGQNKSCPFVATT
jgi:hypothetical protein